MPENKPGNYICNINLLFPIVFVLLAFLEFLFFYDKQSFSPFNSSVNAIFVGFASTFFLNFTHLGVTMSTWINSPVSQKWLGKFFNFRTQIFIFIVVALILALVYFLSLTYRQSPIHYAAVLFDLIFIWHGIGQTKGLSIHLNKQIITDENSRNGFSALESIKKSEDKFMFLLFLSYLIMNLGNRFKIYPNFNVSETQFRWLFVFINLVIVGLLVYKSKSLFSQSRLKVFFAARYLLWIITPISFFGYIGILSVHGIEYALFNYRMLEGSAPMTSFSKWKWNALIFCTMVFIVGCLAPNGFGHFITKNSATWRTLGYTAASIIMSLTTIHVIFDKYFYATKNHEGISV